MNWICPNCKTHMKDTAGDFKYCPDYGTKRRDPDPYAELKEAYRKDPSSLWFNKALHYQKPVWVQWLIYSDNNHPSWDRDSKYYSIGNPEEKKQKSTWVGKLHHAQQLSDDWGCIRDERGDMIIRVSLPTHDEDVLLEHRKNMTDPTQARVNAILAALNKEKPKCSIHCNHNSCPMWNDCVIPKGDNPLVIPTESEKKLVLKRYELKPDEDGCYEINKYPHHLNWLALIWSNKSFRYFELNNGTKSMVPYLFKRKSDGTICFYAGTDLNNFESLYPVAVWLEKSL